MSNRSDVPIPPQPPPLNQAPATSRHTQIAAVILLAIIAGLIGWRLYDDRFRTRPAVLATTNQRIDLNRATKSELMQIPGVGPQMAERIVLHREERGRFGKVDDLADVHGIGDATLNRLRPWLSVRPSDEPRPLPEPDRLIRKPASKSKPLPAISSEKININTATLEQLDQLPNIGKVIAQRIIEAREEKPFASINDLRRVPGIGPKRLEALRDLVTVGE